MADVIAKLKVDAKEYDGGLAKAKKSLDQFTKQNMSLNGVMAQGMTALTKFAGGFAAAELAAKSFNAIIMQGSQTTGDFVRNGVGALNDTIGQLAKSLVTFDWTPFENGLLNVYREAVSLRQELDSLWNEQVARGTVSARTQYRVQSARSVLSDSNATDEQRKSAQNDLSAALADMREANELYAKHLQKVIAQEGEFGSDAVELTFKNVENIYETVAKRGADEAKAIYKPFRDELNKMQARLRELRSQDIRFEGTPEAYDTGEHQQERDDLADMIASYRKYYKEELAGYDVLERNDNEYQKLANHVNAYYNALTEVEGLQRRANVTSNRLGATGNTGASPKSTAKAAEPIKSSMSIQDFDIPDFPSMLNDSIPSMKSLNELAKQFKDDMLSATTTEQYNAAAQSLEKVQRTMELQPIAIQAGISFDEAAVKENIQKLEDEMYVKLQASLEFNQKSIKGASELTDTGKDAQKSFEAASRAISSAGSALQSVDNEGLNIAGTIMQAIADVALGFAMALASPTAAATGPWGWIAAAAAGAATMVATIATIKSATSGSYAQGGIVPGAYNGGLDSTYVYASPGEVILNRAQQENILSQLDDGSSSGNVTFVLNGEKLEGCLNHYGRRSGKGKLVFA